MLVGDFRMISLRSEVLCRLQRFLHLLRVSVDAHTPEYQTLFARQLRYLQLDRLLLSHTPDV